ncbi:MAG: PIN domain-containing protein [Candidatus Omnitrophica bacterium]|nr:PIN domain-containing protein [Candidatus Omnitrophota bacterium]
MYQRPEDDAVGESGLVLFDTSIWIRFFRVTRAPESVTLDTLLSVGAVATCHPIRAEILSGAPTRRHFERLKDLFDAIKLLDPPHDLWRQIEEYRFLLARRGFQAALVDVMIAVTAHAHQISLWTLDDDFSHMTDIIPLTLFQPPVS